MGDANDVRERILALIGQAEGPLTADSLGEALPDVAFPEVIATLEGLVDEGVLSVDLFGFSLVEGAGARSRRGARGTADAALPKVVVRSRESSAHQAADTGDARAEVLFHDSPVALLGLDAEVLGSLEQGRVTSVADLVAREGELASGMGPSMAEALREALFAHAASAPDALDDAEVMLACRVSASLRFAFDAFGRLCCVSDRIAEMGVSSLDALATKEAGVPEAAQEGAMLALASCEGKAFPTMAETFVPCMAHAAVRRVGRSADADAYRDVVLGLIEGSGDLVAACEAHIRLRLVELDDAGALEVAEGDAWDEAVRRVCEGDATLAFDEVSRKVSARRPRVTEWLEGAELDGRDRTVVRDWLRGLTLERCASTWMLTPEQVNQCVRRVLRSAPPVLEENDRYLFETYSISKAEFLEVTGEGVACYRYLRATSDETGAAPLADAVADPRVPAAQRDAIRDLLGWREPATEQSEQGPDEERDEPVQAGPAPLAKTAEDAPTPSVPGATQTGASEAREGFRSFRENQRGVSYEMLFGPYFEGARHVRIVDPYVRLFHQARNIMELMAVLVRHRDFSQDAPTVHLVTGHAGTDAAKQRDYLRKIELALAGQGIVFTWECDLTHSIHARHVFVDDTWDITLDRGLDFWQKYDSSDAFSFEAFMPELRNVKPFEISYRRLDGGGTDTDA